MPETDNKELLSIVVPVYNESGNLEKLNEDIVSELQSTDMNFEIIYVNDGSQDNTSDVIKAFSDKDSRIKLISFTTNFGKENALTAGIVTAKGKAIITIDGDGQHPSSLIPKFIEEWKNGSKVVVGIRKSNDKASWFKKLGSKFFYSSINLISSKKLKPGSTDFRLIDRDVQKAFASLPERDRITRGLIDWLGFKRSYIYFSAEPRLHGSAGYGTNKLIKLAAASFVSTSPTPLYLFSYLGGFITFLSFLLGITVVIEQLILGDPLHWKFTGTAMLSILLVFFVGLVLISQGIMSLYISHIHSQSMQRPLFVIDYENSIGISRDNKTS